MSDVKEGQTVEVPGYGPGEVYELTDDKCVRVRFPNGTSARVDRRNLKPGKAVPTPGAFAGTQPATAQDKARRGPRE